MATRQQPHWHQPSLHPDIRLPPLRVWNSLTRSKTPFVPLDPNGRNVTWYSCGPTVYDDAHLGHARNYISTDILRRILRDYFKFDVKFVMNVTDVDDKIILRARQQHFFSEYSTDHPIVDEEVVRTAKLAYAAYLKANLPLINLQTEPGRFQEEATRAYGFILNGGTLEGNKKPGDDEAKIKMHIKTASSAAKTISEALSKVAETTSDANLTDGNEIVQSENFYSTTQDVFLPFLDGLKATTIDGNEHSIFTTLTKKYEDRFMQDLHDLNVLLPDEVTRVTEYGPEIVEFVEKVIQNKFGYVTADGSVYFDIETFEAAGNHYARLEPWNRNNQRLQRDGEGALSKKKIEKRSPDDFALWKASQPGEPSWASPWGKGRPGWHIECSAMASDKLGKQMDIHSGGIDLAFPHHDNELAQSEAYWYENHRQVQWVSYFFHMGHLSIQGSKMSKSLKNFTTIREALNRGDWTPRSLRIVFLVGGWREGIEITEDLVKAGNVWEDKLNNFFLKVKDPTAQTVSLSGENSVPTQGNILMDALDSAQAKVHESLCDSFDTPGAMSAISELISNYNSMDKSILNSVDVEQVAKWVTLMVTIFGLNGAASPDSPDIGWYGIDIPEHAKRFLYPLSAMRDSLRRVAKSDSQITPAKLTDAVNISTISNEAISDTAKPYADVLSQFRDRVSSLKSTESPNISKELLALCDRVRDIDLFDLGVYLEDRDNESALVRPVTKELLQAREDQAERAQQKQSEKEKRAKLAVEKLDKGKLSHLEMFRSLEFSTWDEDGLPIQDAAGEQITKSRSKKLRKEWERQKKAHEAWLASSNGRG